MLTQKSLYEKTVHTDDICSSTKAFAAVVSGALQSLHAILATIRRGLHESSSAVLPEKMYHVCSLKNRFMKKPSTQMTFARQPKRLQRLSAVRCRAYMLY